MFAVRKKNGFTLVEVLVVAALSVLIFGGLFMSVVYTLKVVEIARAKTSAMSVANDKIEYLRSLPYAQVGTVNGIPPGNIPQLSTVTLNSIPFTVRILIEYVDDPGDGMLTATTTDSNGISADYKRVKVEVTWTLHGETQSVSLVSNIVPRSIETTDGGGTVRINVIDGDSEPLSGASVRLINNSTNPKIDVTKISDATGIVLFSGAPAASNYEVIVSRTGYSTDKTYAATSTNPTPVTAPFALVEDGISTLTFQIDALGSLTITTYSSISEQRKAEWFDDSSGIASSTNIEVSGGVLKLANVAGAYKPSGIAYLNAVAPTPLESWRAFTVAGNAPSGSAFKIRFYTLSGGVYQRIPDSDLPGNSSGFTVPISTLTSVVAATYPSVVAGIELTTNNTSVTPTIDAFELFYRSGVSKRGSVAFSAHGNRIVGHDALVQPIYKSTIAGTTNVSGIFNVSNVEFDTYAFTFPGYTVAQSCPKLPLVQRGGDTSMVDVLLVPAAPDSLLVTVTDSIGTLIPGARVQLSRSGFNDTVTTDSCGQAYFSSGVASASDYQIDVSKSGFNSTVLSPYDLNGESSASVSLVKS